jgi:capsular exopolysaccharide synthesis family protein
VLGLLLGTAATLRPPTYSSTAKILVRPVSVVAPERFVPIEQQLSMETEVEIASSSAVARLAAQDLPGSPTPGSLLARLTVANPPETQILEMSFSAGAARAARAGAQAFAQAYLQYKRQQGEKLTEEAIAGIREQMTALEAELDTVEADLAGAGGTRAQQLRSTRDALLGQLGVLRTRLAGISPQADPGEVIAAAPLPGAPSSPRRAIEMGMGLFLGLFAGVVVAFLRDRMDDRVRGREEVEETLRVPSLWAMPRSHRRGSPSRDLVVLRQPDGEATERYRALGATFLGDHPPRTILVTGATLGDNTAGTAANLAIALAQAGKRVALVGADLRTPRLHELFGLENTVGLADVIANSTPLRSAVQTTDVERLGVVTAGSAEAAAKTMLNPDKIRRIFEELNEAVDVTVVEARPLLSSADVHMLAPLADGVLLMIDLRHTRSPDIARARRELDATAARLLGVIVHNAPKLAD